MSRIAGKDLSALSRFRPQPPKLGGGTVAWSACHVWGQQSHGLLCLERAIALPLLTSERVAPFTPRPRSYPTAHNRWPAHILFALQAPSFKHAHGQRVEAPEPPTPFPWLGATQPELLPVARCRCHSLVTVADVSQRERSRSPRRRSRSPGRQPRRRSYSPRSRSNSRDDYRRNRDRSPMTGTSAPGGGSSTGFGGQVPHRSFEERAAAREQMMNNIRETSQQDRRVYVGNLSYDVKWHHLKDFMRQGTHELGAPHSRSEHG